MPTGRPGCRPVTRAYLGFELFQKTVWRSAAARLQHRPKREAQRNSIARGLARPGGDEGLLRVWVPAGFLGSAVCTALAALAPPLRDSAFWAGAARHPCAGRAAGHGGAHPHVRRAGPAHPRVEAPGDGAQAAAEDAGGGGAEAEGGWGRAFQSALGSAPGPLASPPHHPPACSGPFSLRPLP